jgi:plastocyanin
LIGANPDGLRQAIRFIGRTIADDPASRIQEGLSSMRFPRIVVAVGLIAAGLLLPALGPRLQPPMTGVIGMGHDSYVVSGVGEDDGDETAKVPEIVIHVGETITFQNNSRWIHIVGPGDKGLLTAQGAGAMTPRKMMEQNESYTTAPWPNPGTYLITCTVHPDMNAKVVVLP